MFVIYFILNPSLASFLLARATVILCHQSISHRTLFSIQILEDIAIQVINGNKSFGVSSRVEVILVHRLRFVELNIERQGLCSHIVYFPAR